MMKPTLTLNESLPYPFVFRPDRTALVVIDMQNDFCAPEDLGNGLEMIFRPHGPLSRSSRASWPLPDSPA